MPKHIEVEIEYVKSPKRPKPIKVEIQYLTPATKPAHRLTTVRYAGPLKPATNPKTDRLTTVSATKPRKRRRK